MIKFVTFCALVFTCVNILMVIEHLQMKNVSHIEYMNTRFLQCVFFCVQSYNVSL